MPVKNSEYTLPDGCKVPSFTWDPEPDSDDSPAWLVLTLSDDAFKDLDISLNGQQIEKTEDYVFGEERMAFKQRREEDPNEDLWTAFQETFDAKTMDHMSTSGKTAWRVYRRPVKAQERGKGTEHGAQGEGTASKVDQSHDVDP